jgi:hypothetical protein
MSEVIRFGGIQEGRGLTLEESWFLNAIIIGGQNIFLINNQQPPQPIERVGRKVLLSPEEIILSLKNKLPNITTPNQAVHYRMLVYDGNEVAHTVTLHGIDKNSGFFIFWDPWGGRSLLCEENNSANVAAIPHPESDRIWLVNPAQLQDIIYAIIMPFEDWQSEAIW